MEKKDLINLLNEIFIPLSFKRKGNNWVLNGEAITKVVNLQKSNYGNLFYINYGYIIKSIELTTVTHIGNRLAGSNKDEQKKIADLLNLDITIENRVFELKEFIVNKIVSKVQKINTEADLLDELKQRPHLNDIPLTVKKHFNLL